MRVSKTCPNSALKSAGAQAPPLDATLDGEPHMASFHLNDEFFHSVGELLARLEVSGHQQAAAKSL